MAEKTYEEIVASENGSHGSYEYRLCVKYHEISGEIKFLEEKLQKIKEELKELPEFEELDCSLKHVISQRASVNMKDLKAYHEDLYTELLKRKLINTKNVTTLQVKFDKLL